MGLFCHRLPIFGGCLVLAVLAGKEKICDGNEYTIVNSTGSFVRCLRCDKCHPGFGLQPQCGSTLLEHPNIGCHKCEVGTFSSEINSSPCFPCHQCAQYELIKTPCSSTSDTVCSGNCEKGYYKTTKAPHNCQKCSACCSDEKDEKIDDCVSQGLDERCSPRPDKDCSSGSKSGGLSTATISVIGVIAVVVIAVAIAVTTYFCYKKRKRNEQPDNEASRTSEVPEQAATTVPIPDSCADVDSHVAPTNTRVQWPNGQNPTYQGTPHGSQHDLHSSVSNHYSVPNSAVRQNQNTDQPQSGSPQSTAAVEQVQLSDEKKSRAPLHRQSSQDSQSSGDGEVKFRKRSGSAIGLEKLKQKFSDRGDSLLEEEQDETHEPIKIDKHPKSQTAKEGSKVELKCKVQGKSNKLIYQWFKDGEALLTKTASSLVLDPVELRDFGQYMCYVSYQDSYGDGVKSSSAKLDVIPQCQNGRRPKYLAELDHSTTEKVGVLLQNRKFGLGGWREVAAKYELEPYRIDQLSSSKEPGKLVLEYVTGSKPNLTVYDFCKVLKEDNIKRFDIVKALEDHLLVREGSEYI